MAVNITTAVDSLVRLVNEEGRISLDDAAKKLGLPHNIVNEWAVFLDQEKIIHIEYKFTTPYLVSIEREEKQKKEKKPKKDEEEEGIYDLVIRRLEIIEAHLEQAKPTENRRMRQKEYLVKTIKKLIEHTKKKKIYKSELKKFIKYYNIFEKGRG